MPCVLSYRRIQRTQFSLSLKRKCSEASELEEQSTSYKWFSHEWSWSSWQTHEHENPLPVDQKTPERLTEVDHGTWLYFPSCVGQWNSCCQFTAGVRALLFLGKTKRLQYWKPQVRLWPKTAQEPDSTQWRKNPRRHNNTNQIKLNDPDPTSTLALVSSAPSWTGYTFQRDF